QVFIINIAESDFRYTQVMMVSELRPLGRPQVSTENQMCNRYTQVADAADVPRIVRFSPPSINQRRATRDAVGDGLDAEHRKRGCKRYERQSGQDPRSVAPPLQSIRHGAPSPFIGTSARQPLCRVWPACLNYPARTIQSMTHITTAVFFRWYNVCGNRRVGLTLGIWFNLGARGRSPHVRIEAPAHC